MTTTQKVLIGAAIVLVLGITIYVVTKKPTTGTPGTPAGPGTNPLGGVQTQQQQQIAYLTNYEPAWTAGLTAMNSTDLNTLYTYVSQEIMYGRGGGQEPTNASFNAAAAVVKKYNMPAQGTYFD